MLNLLEITENQFRGIIAGFGIFAIIVILLLIALVVFYIIAEVKLFKKAGKAGWEAIVPFYNNWVYVEISGLEWYWFLLLIATTLASFLFGNNSAITSIASLATIFGSFVCNYNLAKKFHKEVSFAILMTIFPVVMVPLVAFSKDYVYDANVEVSKNGIFK